MNGRQRDAHLRTLKAVHTKMQNWENEAGYGICTHYKLELDRTDLSQAGVDGLMCHLEDEFTRWPKFSGSRAFPIPSPTDRGYASHEAAYYAHCDDRIHARKASRWDRKNSPYAALRWEMLEWLIARAEEGR